MRVLLDDVEPSLLEQEVDADVPRILILEDYPPLRRVLTALLQRAGYRVALAHTARETLQLLEQHIYDLLVMDMDSAKADGRRVIQVLQAAPRHLPVVALLSPQSHWVRGVMTLGVQTVLYKPVGRQALLQGIKTSLASQDDGPHSMA